MTTLSFWRSYDKHGRAFYSATVRGTGRQLAIVQIGPQRFELELDGEVYHRGFARLADAKRTADLLADELIREHHDRLILDGINPPELFQC